MSSRSSNDSKKISTTKADEYPYPSLWLNGRDVPVAAVRTGDPASLATTPFEESTLDFVRAWLNGETTFTLHTSGSTGTPKPMTVSRQQMLTSAAMTAAALGLTAGYTALVCLDTRYIAGKMMLVRCLTTGMHIVAVTPSSNPLAAVPDTISVDFTALVPYQVYALLESPEKARLGAIRHTLIGGAALDPRVLPTLATLPGRFYATYGMTETISHIALQYLNGPAAAPIFRALPGVTLTTDDRGCLVIHAPHVPQPVVTNDLVDMTAPGSFQWLGRWDNVINSGGVKIIPEKVEEAIGAVLNGLNLTRSFIVCGLPDPNLGHKLTLIVDGIEFTPQQWNVIQAKLRQSLPAYEVPKDHLSVPAFRYTDTGKIHRQKTIEIVTKPY
ncbi:AMP-binding protein [Dawidia soli]|uniref:AMP-binding protein n=1 Tax=Dawidia soli TaxID=2782352 RepID=A0AAP2DFE9_9BACT|nr:AMP-binding protein [Dawidia soli]MBT1688362.1 AMP-binding protein [Dawidia soli]